ncbi:TatD family hydrolase [Coprothermobacter platensis]|uniref:TatD family hydrolase n=1 Tax=Coprothermobacter platensis TaxID=108819 RepID=UPI0003663101|nr:TatD family hydrolase [Coprothermobacter platensis]
MTPSYIDSHTHLQDDAFDDDRDEVLKKVRSSLVSFLWVGYDIESSKKALELRNESEPVAVGVHPHDATGSVDELKKWEYLYQQADAVGEIGLDTVRSQTKPDDQLLWFKRQLEIALYYNKPVIIHEREAFDAVMDVFNTYRINVPVIFHCFSHGSKEVLQVLKKDFFISFTANITYPKSDDIRAALSVVPLDHLLLETDSPYLPPQIIRGKRNDPTFVVEVYKKTCELRGIDMEYLSTQVLENFTSVFPTTLPFLKHNVQ